jgi:hypothetical protein
VSTVRQRAARGGQTIEWKKGAVGTGLALESAIQFESERGRNESMKCIAPFNPIRNTGLSQ